MYDAHEYPELQKRYKQTSSLKELVLSEIDSMDMDIDLVWVMCHIPEFARSLQPYEYDYFIAYYMQGKTLYDTMFHIHADHPFTMDWIQRSVLKKFRKWLKTSPKR